MKHLIVLSCIFFTNAITAFAQQDTTTTYLNKLWQPTSSPDSAFLYTQLYQQNGLWTKKMFWVKGNVLKSEGSYIDKACKIPQGTSKAYNENGTLRSIVIAENGHGKTADYFYESGKKMGHIDYTAKGAKQTGWDENGELIPNFVVEKEAVFPGGPEAWRSYLEENLDASVAARSKAKPGIYTVKVQFIVDKDGNVSNVNAIEVPKDCSRCGKEAVRVIKQGPGWEPAVQYNRRVIYQAIQHISFQVSEE
ncbi:hypothetical protein EXU57_14100 [Segetibacter sp. 3557_3]|uniref:hypothetical protein n=1 Tax=Segetibacter sp. 3557_3 TaxID=2547429 RepID=UPI001058D3C9|nr:hypothetical protein [Segetibacter sp. 3557_3]TDH25233.1 hypothetical protein EXU57_14100 [Segetibacter sp. 3557_3]